MKIFGFVYKRTTKVTLPLDTPSFMAAPTSYFTPSDKFRSNGSKIFWHDETWCNQCDGKSCICTYGATGTGRLRQNEGKD